VLIAGGRGPCGASCGITQGTGELYDPGSNTFSSAGNLAAARQEQIAIRLDDGKVLLAGGFSNAVGSGPIASAEIYTPGSGFIATGAMGFSREEGAGAKLADGRVFVSGGYGSGGNTAEIYDPTAGTFAGAGSNMSVSRALHTATFLPGSGKVLIVGGIDGSSLATAELFDPSTGLFTATGSLATARHGHIAVLLPNGKVLIAGGINLSSGTLASAELYDPAGGGTFSSAGAMTIPRQEFTATSLADGKVLLAGGRSAGSQNATLEVYDPVAASAGTFTAVGTTMSSGRAGHAASLLSSGKVLISGGDSASASFLATTSVYQP
jgi:hypothetical protein